MRRFVSWFVLVWSGLILAAPAIAQDPAPITIEPGTLNAQLCNQQCITQTINVTLPPINHPPILNLDLLLVMDITGSMGDELESVKSSAGDIVTILRNRVPDMRFGFGVYADYPNVGGDLGDIPWQLIAPFSTNLDSFRSRLSSVSLQGGGDSAESMLRAVAESAALDWRPDALHVLVMFSDAPSHDPDAGVDGILNTSDDLTFDDTSQMLVDKSIIFLGVHAGFRGGDEFERYANRTQGTTFTLSDSDEIPATVVQLVGAELDKQTLQLRASPQNFSAPSSGSWISFSPSTLDYPAEGITIPATVNMCPGELNLPDGDYITEIQVVQGTKVYATTVSNFQYYPQCADFVIRDTNKDTGSGCTSDQVYWDSPDIIVRNKPDNGTVTQKPVIGTTNYIYVNVTNQGPLEYTTQLVLYQSGGDWNEVGRETITLASQEWQIVGPFEITPDSTTLSLRAVVDSDEDKRQADDNPACDNNQAEQHRAYMHLDNPTIGGLGEVGGTLSIDLRGKQPGTEISIELDLSQLKGHARVTNENGEGISGDANSLSGTLRTLGKLLFTLITGDPSPGIVPVAFSNLGGINLYYTVDTGAIVVPRSTVSETKTTPLDQAAVLVAIGLAVLGVLIIIVVLISNRQSTQNIQT